MIELPDFSPLRVTATTLAPTRATLDRLDHLLVVTAPGNAAQVARLPYCKQLPALFQRARRNGDDFASSRAANESATGLTLGTFAATPGFAALSWAAKALRECLRDKPRSLGIALVGLDASAERTAAESLAAAAHAAAFALPEFKSAKKTPRPARPSTLHLFATHDNADLASAHAEALGNNVARWFTALPPNV